MIKLSHPFFKTGLPLIGATVAGWLVLSSTLERRIQRKVHHNPTRPAITSSITLPLNKLDISLQKLIWPLSALLLPTTTGSSSSCPRIWQGQVIQPRTRTRGTHCLPSHSQLHPNHYHHHIHNLNTHTHQYSLPLTSFHTISLPRGFKKSY